jgi:hypothetical protein
MNGPASPPRASVIASRLSRRRAAVPAATTDALVHGAEARDDDRVVRRGKRGQQIEACVKQASSARDPWFARPWSNGGFEHDLIIRGAESQLP